MRKLWARTGPRLTSKKRSQYERVRIDLLRAARHGKTVTYGTLMSAFGLSRGKALTRMIAAVDRHEYSVGAPGFAAIVVRKDTGYPGGGYFCDDTLPRRIRRASDRGSDPRLSAAEMAHIKRKRREIWRFYGGSSSRR